VKVLLDELISVSFHLFRIRSYPVDAEDRNDDYDSDSWYELGCDGQVNGLCGAAIPGMLSFTTGMHTGEVSVRVEKHEGEPSLDPAWEEVVEVPFSPRGPDLQLEWEDGESLPLTVDTGMYRVRYCAINFIQDDEMLDAGERYLIQLWPAEPMPDVVVRQSRSYAAYWHEVARRSST
jgi:hypothetical protein